MEINNKNNKNDKKKKPKKEKILKSNYDSQFFFLFFKHDDNES